MRSERRPIRTRRGFGCLNKLKRHGCVQEQSKRCEIESGKLPETTAEHARRFAEASAWTSAWMEIKPHTSNACFETGICNLDKMDKTCVTNQGVKIGRCITLVVGKSSQCFRLSRSHGSHLSF